MVHETRYVNEWQKGMSQILMYMTSEETRYGFILTDANLVVLRITRRHIGDGLAASRARRDATAANPSVTTTLTGLAPRLQVQIQLRVMLFLSVIKETSLIPQ
jgi:hypothetical protein